jgi:WD40 repeat protein
MTVTISPSGPTPQAQRFGEPHLHTDHDIVALCFAKDGTLWSLEEEGVLRRWDVQTGEQLEWHALSDLETLWCFSHDGRVLASASDDLTLWDTSSGHVLTALPQDSWVTSLAFHPDHAYLATGHDEGTVRFWDFAGHVIVHHLRYHKKPISSLVISPDGTKLAAASEDKIISVWDLKTGQILGTLKGHTDRIPALAWHPTMPKLVSAGWDTTARVWNLLDFEPEILLNTHVGQVTALAFSRDGKLLACSDSRLQVHLWDFDTKKTRHVLKGPEVEVRVLSFSPDGARLAASGDRLIHVWNTATGQSLSSERPAAGARHAVAVHPSGTHFASNGGGNSCRVWNVASKTIALPLEESNSVHHLAYSPDGTLLAAAARDHVRLWDSATGKVAVDLVESAEPTTTLAWSADGTLLATASREGLDVWVWRTADGEPALLIPDALDGCSVESLAFHPKEPLLAVAGIDYLATGGSTGAIALWSVSEKAELHTFAEGATVVVFHPNGKKIAAGTTDHAICLWDATTHDLLDELDGHEGLITALVYSPDGKILVSAGADNTLRIWSDKGEELGCFEVDSQVTSLSFTADGQSLYAGHANTTSSHFRVADIVKRK